MLRRSIRGGLLKFSLYWVALVASCLVIFVISALHMIVKPLHFEAPVGSLNDVFSPDVCPPNHSDHVITQHIIFQVILTAEAISVDPISRTITMNWYPELINLDCKSNIPRVYDIYLQRWVSKTFLQISWTHIIGEAHSWIWAVPHGMLSSRTNLPSGSIVRGSAPSTKHLLRSELSRSLLLLSSFSISSPLAASRRSRAILSMCMSNLCPSAIKNSRWIIRYLAPFSFYCQNNDTGAITAPRVSRAFGVAV